ncbi:hypothetical protein [Ligilactobacillus ruminis]|uniref:hypothetical protein n=1 Tax=Ligilactobacillus ruminis TaxID=1623 RepID=UPI001F4ED934|nr:hypothetical protein [Ligilactobacillus ruminis]
MAHLQKINEQRQPAKRYNEAQLRRKTEKHLKEFIENLESQLKRTIPDEYDSPEDWIRFFDDNRVTEELELSIAEMEFDE